jgi:enterobactin synthetase component F
MYRTGDVARWLDNGAVEYLGRSDDQLKIRGQRIELGEIDRAMLSLPDVAQAVAHACVFNQAAATGGDARQLVGYVVSESGLPLDRDALLESLKAQLPPHMVPVVLLQISALPLSANGKLDRKALPLPELTSKTSGRAPETKPKSPWRRRLPRCWAARSTTLRPISLPSAATRCWRCAWRHSSAARSTARSRRGRLWSPRR